MAAFFVGLLNHEGFGTGGQNNGHEAQRRILVALPENDPRAAVEPLVARALDQLELFVGAAVDQIDVRVSNAAAAHQFVHGNWCGEVYVQNSQKNNNPYDLFRIWMDPATATCL